MKGKACPHCGEPVILVDSRSASTAILCKSLGHIQQLPLQKQCPACGCTEFERVGSAGTYYWCPECNKIVNPITVERQPLTADDINILSSCFTQPPRED
jgi:hypothetical protein